MLHTHNINMFIVPKICTRYTKDRVFEETLIEYFKCNNTKFTDTPLGKREK